MIYYHFNIPTVGPFRCADTHICICDNDTIHTHFYWWNLYNVIIFIDDYILIVSPQ